MLAIDPELFADVHGSTDTEVVFQLALTFGLEEDPIGALERTVGFIEATARRPRDRRSGAGQLRRLGRHQPVGRALRDQGTSPVAVRLRRRRLVRRLHPENPRFQRLTERPSDRLRAVLRPSGVWHEIPAGTAVTVRAGGFLEHRPFHPVAVAAG